MKRIISFLLGLALLCGCGASGESSPSGTLETKTETVSEEPAEAKYTGESASPQEEEKSASADLFAMDTVMSLRCSGANADEAIQAAKKEILRLDQLLSVGIETSEISRLNREGRVQFSEDTAAIVEGALSLWEETGGAFDITVYPLMKLWGFTTGN